MHTGDRRREIGRIGEEHAATLLRARGAEVLDRNWICSQGELDLVVRDAAGRLRFVEVRTRTGTSHGTAAESVTAGKQERIRTLARAWLAGHPGPWRPVSFDVVAVDLSDADRPRLEVFEDAF